MRNLCISRELSCILVHCNSFLVQSNNSLKLRLNDSVKICVELISSSPSFIRVKSLTDVAHRLPLPYILSRAGAHTARINTARNCPPQKHFCRNNQNRLHPPYFCKSPCFYFCPIASLTTELAPPFQWTVPFSHAYTLSPNCSLLYYAQAQPPNLQNVTFSKTRPGTL